jgi:hypothetical protein
LFVIIVHLSACLLHPPAARGIDPGQAAVPGSDILFGSGYLLSPMGDHRPTMAAFRIEHFGSVVKEHAP